MIFLRSVLLTLLILASAPLQAASPPPQRGDSGWFYRDSDIPPDPAWTFGTLPNGLRYAVRRNAFPAGQVSIRVRIDAGSLHESDNERGWAHFVEHMAFRGSKDFADREARHVWEKLGASFGSDSNATTGPTQTVYQLDLPDADRADLDLSLNVIAQMMDNALFASPAVDAERKIVLQEKGRRPEIGVRMIEASWPLYYAGLKIADRETIGTDATLGTATPEGLRGFYERWYRPDRATVVLVGDADPAMMEELIAKHFGGWATSGPAPVEPDYGSIAGVTHRTAPVAYPGAPHSASLMWLRPYERLPNTKAREKTDLARTIAARIVNRRLEAQARGIASYVSSSVGQSRQPGIAEYTQLSVTAKDGKWREALAESFGVIGDALSSPPSGQEIARELSNIRTAVSSALAGEGTVRSQQRAQQIVNAIDSKIVVSTAATSVALIEEFSPEMTPEVVGGAMRAMFEGAGPRMVLLAPEAISQAEAEAALAAAEKAAPVARLVDRSVSFDDLPPPGAPGREVSRERVEDMDVTIVRFANGSSLTFKQTDFEKGSVQVALNFGSGLSGMAQDAFSPWTMSSLVGPSGVADLDLDAMERLLTGRKIAMSFAVAEDSFVYRGATNGTDLHDQLRLLAAKIAHPRWDQALFARMKTSLIQNYELQFSSASARGRREFPGVAHPGDRRWAAMEKDRLAQTSLPEVQAFFDPLLAVGPIEAIIVGDVDVETAVAAMRHTIAALPARAPAPSPARSLLVQPPAPASAPATFTHNGDANQAFALVGWATFGGMDKVHEGRALNLAANIFRVRLFDRFREAEGSSYSPSAAANSSIDFPGWGIFYAASEIQPESSDAFFRAAREIVADLAARPVQPDEFERALNPVKSGIERRVKTNGYWLGALGQWTRDSRRIDLVRDYAAGYARLTAEDVRAAVARHVKDEGDWSMLVLPAKAKDGAS